MTQPHSLSLDSSYAQLFGDYLKKPKQTEHLFVITHLGQLKQMEALIVKKNLTNNGLIVLYTTANFVVPQTVHDKVAKSLFDFVVFVEIPFKINQINYFKLKTVYETYVSLLNANKPKTLYLNSFEGHYAILIDIAKKRGIRNALVEEGTATYKLLSQPTININHEDSINFEFLKTRFMLTIGQTELFKRAVKQKKYTKDFLLQSKYFCQNLILDEKVQGKLIEVLGKGSIKSYKKPFLQFDEVYASFPSLIEQSFLAKDVQLFNIYESIDSETLALAKEIVSDYDITDKDALYLSQRYTIDPIQYVNTVTPILLKVTRDSRKVFIKLHPKESNKVHQAFKKITDAFPNKLILIEDNRFLVEPVMKVSNIQKVIGLTSTALVYAPLVSHHTQSISVAQALIDNLPKTEQNAIGSATIKEHLEILKIFDNIQFYGA